MTDHSLEAFINIIIMSVLLGSILIVSAYLEIRKIRFNSRIHEALLNVVPNLEGSGYDYSFHVHGLNASLNFADNSMDSNGHSFFSVNFSSKTKKKKPSNIKSSDKNSRQRFNQIFHIILEEKQFYGDVSQGASDLKKILKINADDPILKQRLETDEALQNSLREIYLAAGGVEVNVSLTRDSFDIQFFSLTDKIETAKKFVTNAISVLELSLILAAKSDIRLACRNPFQRDRQDSMPPEYNAPANDEPPVDSWAEDPAMGRENSGGFAGDYTYADDYTYNAESGIGQNAGDNPNVQGNLGEGSGFAGGDFRRPFPDREYARRPRDREEEQAKDESHLYF